MATWKKTNEAYFGDSFDRLGTLAFATEDGSNYSTAINAIKWNDNGEATLSCDAVIGNDLTAITAATMCKGATSHAEGLSNAAYGKADYSSMKLCVDDLALNKGISSLSSKLDELQAQIDDLKRKKTATSELRRALHTLHYKSEVERL